VISLDEDPFPTHPGFQFGLVGEEFTGDRRDVEAPSADENGKARLSVMLNDLPDLTRPLAATIRVGVFEPSGRAVYETVSRPIRKTGGDRAALARRRRGSSGRRRGQAQGDHGRSAGLVDRD
jgi:uncharacterized protein YfaS (alpha-2-macroglobulin family)